MRIKSVRRSGSYHCGSIPFLAPAGDSDPLLRTLVWDVRAPRVVLLALAGAALAAAGAASVIGCGACFLGGCCGSPMLAVYAGFLGGKYEGVRIVNNQPPANLTAPPSVAPALAGTVDRIRRSSDERFRRGRANGPIHRYGTTFPQAQALMQRREIFDLAKESPADHERYGGHDFGQHCLLARRLLEAGVTCAVEVDQHFAALHPELRPGPHVLLSVRDTGHGMTPEVLERIFEAVLYDQRGWAGERNGTGGGSWNRCETRRRYRCRKSAGSGDDVRYLSSPSE